MWLRFDWVDRSFSTDVRAKPARPDNGAASVAFAVHEPSMAGSSARERRKLAATALPDGSRSIRRRCR